MKKYFFRVIAVIGVFLTFASLVIIITKTPEPKPKAGSIDIIEQAKLDPNNFGGDYILTDQNNEEFNSKSLRGKYQLIYFGFTSCPDICPASILEMVKAASILKENENFVGDIQPIFITIDPKRDTVEVLKSYFDSVDDSIIALTSDEAEISKIAKLFRVYYSEASGSKKDSEDYMVNHSSFFYLVSPEGKFVKHYVPGAKGEAIARDIIKITNK